MWEFDNTKYFFLLIIVGLLLSVYMYEIYWQKKARKNFATPKAFLKLAPRYSRFNTIIKSIILLLALIFIVMGLADLKMASKVETIKRQGIDIVFAIDISKSMLAQDIAPDRLRKTKQIVNQIISNLSSDRIGIVGYSGSAFPILPITTDYNIARMYLQNMNTDMVSSMGTDFEDAIRISANYFAETKGSKLIIMISDGEDHGNGIEQAMDICKNENIKVISIAVGTQQGAPIPIETNNGIEYKRDNNGQMVITKMNPNELKKIANKTNGAFFIGENTAEVVNSVISELKHIEKTDFESKHISEQKHHFQYFVGFAILLLIMDIFIFERKRFLNKNN